MENENFTDWKDEKQKKRGWKIYSIPYLLYEKVWSKNAFLNYLVYKILSLATSTNEMKLEKELLKK